MIEVNPTFKGENMAGEIDAKIEDLRKKIDQLDGEIIAKLNQRAEIVIAIKELKSQGHIPIFDPKREEEILERIAAVNTGPLYDDALKELYEQILHAMKDLEDR
jgi:monofunctional chorismate mutase